MTGRAIRVLQVVDNLGMGGAETWLMALLRHWRDSGGPSPTVDFLATGSSRGYYDEEARALGATIFRIPFGLRHLPNFAAKFQSLLRLRGYDAIHDHQDYASGWHFMFGSLSLPRIRITHVHNPAYQVEVNYGGSFRRRLVGRIGKRLIAGYTTHIAGTSRQAIEEHGLAAAGFASIPKSVLHCGFDTRAFAIDRSAAGTAVRSEFGWGRETRIVLVAGRIDASPELDHPRNHKNSAFAVNVGIAAAGRDSRLRMIFAGTPSLALPELEARIVRAGLSGRIVFAGVRKDIPRLMAGSDLLLFPSRSEGLGMVAVEAQAAGLPVLASSAVPAECVVVPELIRFMSLDLDATTWAENVVAMTESRDSPHSDANQRVSASAFSIAHSARALEKLYGTGQF